MNRKKKIQLKWLEIICSNFILKSIFHAKIGKHLHMLYTANIA